MSEETDRHGESASDGAGGGSNAIRVLLTPHQIDAANADSLRAAWRNQDLYIDHLESLNKQLEGIYEKFRLGSDLWSVRPSVFVQTLPCYSIYRQCFN